MMKRMLIGLLMLMFLGLVGTQLQAQPKLLIWADDTRSPVLRDVGTTFTQETGVVVEVVEIAFADLRGQFITTAPTGEGPDILIGAHDWVGELVVNGLLEPIDLGDKASAFNPVALEGFSYGGKLYGTPYGTENVALIYNKDLVSRPPQTWSDLLNMARAMTDPEKSIYGYIVQNPDPYHWFPVLSACGGYIFGTRPDGSLDPSDIGLATEGAIRGARLFDSMVEQGLLPAGVDWDTMTGLFFGGKAGMVISGPWLLGGAKSAGINYGVAAIPSIQCPNGAHSVPRPFIGVQGFMVSAFSQNKTLAFDFLLNYVATTETMLELFNRDPRPPAYLPAFREVASDPDIAAFGGQATVGIPMPNIPEMASVWGAWADAQDLIATQQADPAVALRNAVEQIRAALGL
ncbi:MAG: extracellular solute-binding protein [Candidatus Bipolaricaulia bacterium]